MSDDAPGWRHDPFSGPGWERYWDGKKFTSEVRETQAQPPVDVAAPSETSPPVTAKPATPTPAHPALRLVAPTVDEAHRPRPRAQEPRRTPVPPRSEAKADEARQRRRTAAGAPAGGDRPLPGARIGVFALVGAVVAVAIAVATSGTSSHSRTTPPTHPGAVTGSSLPSATNPVTTTSLPPLPSSTDAATTTTSVAVCPTGAVTVSLSLAASPGSGGTWTVALKGSATNTSTGSLHLDRVIADIRDGSGTVVATISAQIAQADLAPHFSTSLSGSGQVSSAKPPTVAFQSATATWTGPGTANCPVPR